MDKMLWLAQFSYCCVEYLYILYICIFFFVFDEENNKKILLLEQTTASLNLVLT